MEYGWICGFPVWYPGRNFKGNRLLSSGMSWLFGSTWPYFSGWWTSRSFSSLRCHYILQSVFVWRTSRLNYFRLRDIIILTESWLIQRVKLYSMHLLLWWSLGFCSFNGSWHWYKAISLNRRVNRFRPFSKIQSMGSSYSKRLSPLYLGTRLNSNLHSKTFFSWRVRSKWNNPKSSS